LGRISVKPNQSEADNRLGLIVAYVPIHAVDTAMLIGGEASGRWNPTVALFTTRFFVCGLRMTYC
jgi:hypothetical protein